MACCCPGSFDLTYSMESGEHMPDKAQFVGELCRVTTPGGRVIVVTWCHRSLDPPPLSTATATQKSSSGTSICGKCQRTTHKEQRQGTRARQSPGKITKQQNSVRRLCSSGQEACRAPLLIRKRRTSVCVFFRFLSRVFPRVLGCPVCLPLENEGCKDLSELLQGLYPAYVVP